MRALEPLLLPCKAAKSGDRAGRDRTEA